MHSLFFTVMPAVSLMGNYLKGVSREAGCRMAAYPKAWFPREPTPKALYRSSSRPEVCLTARCRLPARSSEAYRMVPQQLSAWCQRESVWMT